MRPVSKSPIGLLLVCLMAGGATLSSAPSAAQETPAPPVGKAQNAAKKKPVAKPKAKAAGTAKTAAQPAAKPAPTPTVQPAMVRPRDEEAQHVARYDAAIAPVRDLAISAEDAGKLREAIAAAAGGRLGDAKALRDKITDPAARKLVDWYLYRGGYGTATEIRAFLDANPAWPERGLLTQRAEEALFHANPSPRDIKAFFAGSEPRTAIGQCRPAGRARVPVAVNHQPPPNCDCGQ